MWHLVLEAGTASRLQDNLKVKWRASSGPEHALSVGRDKAFLCGDVEVQMEKGQVSAAWPFLGVLAESLLEAAGGMHQIFGISPVKNFSSDTHFYEMCV